MNSTTRHAVIAFTAALLFAPLAKLHASDLPLSDFHHLIHEQTWTENWPDAVGKSTSRTVTAEVWTQAMQGGSMRR